MLDRSVAEAKGVKHRMPWDGDEMVLLLKCAVLN